MKATKCLVIAAILSAPSFARSEHKDFFAGDWEIVTVGEFNASVKHLRIGTDSYDTCHKIEECELGLPGRTVEFRDGLVLLRLEYQGSLAILFVLGGYSHPDESVLFGTRYHYDEGGVINGIPLVYVKLRS